MSSKIIESESDYVLTLSNLYQNTIADSIMGNKIAHDFCANFQFDINDVNKYLPIFVGKHIELKLILAQLVGTLLNEYSLNWLKCSGLKCDKKLAKKLNVSDIFKFESEDELFNFIDKLKYNYLDGNHNLNTDNGNVNYFVTTKSNEFNLHVTINSIDLFNELPNFLAALTYFMKIIEFLINDSTVINKSASMLFVNCRKYSLHKIDRDENLDNYISKYNKCKLSTPTNLQFTKQINNWKDAQDGDITLNQLLDEIIDSNFNIFNFQTVSKSSLYLKDWKNYKPAKK